MSDDRPKVVYDCNIFIQSIINLGGPAGRCIDKVRTRQVTLIVSAFVLAEIQESHRKIPAKYGVSEQQTAALAKAVTAVANLVDDIPATFAYPRDPDDAHYVNLALAAQANLIVSRDRDLLDLMDVTRGEAVNFRRQFPRLRILDPVQFLREIDAARRS